MKGIVLYKSRYGKTLQYASWIAEELGWELRDFSNFKRSEVNRYKEIIFLTGVYIGRMNKIKRAISFFDKRKVIICACGGNNFVEKEIDRITMKNFRNNELATHKFFYLPGGVDFSKVKGFEGMMLRFYKKALQKKNTYLMMKLRF